MSPRHSCSKRQGTVVLEILVVTFLTGVIVLAIYGALIYGYSASIVANHYAIAGQIAGQEIEAIRATGWNDLSTPYAGSLLFAQDPAGQLPFGSGNRTVSYADSPTNSIKQATVTVGWSYKGKQRTVVYTTYVVEGGLNQ